MTTFHVGEDSMSVYVDGKLASVIPWNEYVYVIAEMAAVLRRRASYV